MLPRTRVASAHFQVQLLLNQHPKSFSSGLLSNHSSHSRYFVFGIAPTQVQDPTLVLFELQEVCMCPPLKPVQFPLDGIPSFHTANHTKQLGVISKLSKGALNSSDILIYYHLA